MKTKWMCMTLMLALGLNLSACGSRQENGSSSENETVKIESQSFFRKSQRLLLCRWQPDYHCGG